MMAKRKQIYKGVTELLETGTAHEPCACGDCINMIAVRHVKSRSPLKTR